MEITSVPQPDLCGAVVLAVNVSEERSFKLTDCVDGGAPARGADGSAGCGSPCLDAFVLQNAAEGSWVRRKGHSVP